MMLRGAFFMKVISSIGLFQEDNRPWTVSPQLFFYDPKI